VPSIHETAYPRLKSSITQKEFERHYTPNQAELALTLGSANGGTGRLSFLVLLKTFQRLGYFVMLSDVPERLVAHLASTLKLKKTPSLTDYDDSGTRRRHISAIREFLQVRAFDEMAKNALLDATREASLTKEDLADIINVGIEELLRLRFELPAFSTIHRTAQYAKTQINKQIYGQVNAELGGSGRELIDALLKVPPGKTRSQWDNLKNEPGKPTVKNIRKLVSQLEWLKTWYLDLKALGNLPDVKLRHFAAEAKSLDTARMQELEANKRYTLACAFLKMLMARRLDDLGEVLIRRIQKIHTKGKEALAEHRAKHQAETDALIGKLHDILIALRDTDGSHVSQRLEAIESAAGSDTEESIQRCEAHEAFAGDNYAPFLWRFHKGHRTVLLRLLDNIQLVSTSTDKSTEAAIRFILVHRTSKADRVSTEELDLSWVSDKWRKVLSERQNQKHEGTVDRRHFEVCVFSQIMHELKSGDLCIPGSDRYSDYTEQLISWSEFEKTMGYYCEQAGLSSDRSQFIADLKDCLTTTAEAVDTEFPDNSSLRIENGEPILTKAAKKKESPQIAKLEQFIDERLEHISILDVLADSEHWLNWTRLLGPLSGHDSKLENPKPRYVTTVFAYGCGLGPSQTARSLKLIDRRQIARINQRHVTEETLDKIITEIINKYNKFALPKVWGSGKSASADGTKWDLYEQNLLSEYHIRYGGYGGLGYYHVSDTYIALFSHFIPCGVWEAVYILDGLLKNQSDIQPDTLHADTQGQSTPVFGLAHLLGINLMPRIRNWKDLKLFRPSNDTQYKHIDALFTDTIDWDLIENHIPDLLRIVLSIKTGRVSASTILRRLGTYSRKNKLYSAFAELGRVTRTIFLLKYISDPELRSTISAATNKSEQFNDFIKWIRFGADGVIQENDRDEQRKLIKYNHLVANCLILHNVCTLTRLLSQLAKEGHTFDEATIGQISPYIRHHVNRFGDYVLNMDRGEPLPTYDFGSKHKKFANVS
jgi:TnpA family transposase